MASPNRKGIILTALHPSKDQSQESNRLFPVGLSLFPVYSYGHPRCVKVNYCVQHI